MSEIPVVIGLVLLAVLVGALLPVFYHAAQTLKSTRTLLDTTGPRLDRALEEFTETVTRLNRIAAKVEQEGERLKPLVDSAASVGQTLQGLKHSLRSAGSILTALGPAFLAGVSAFRSRRSRRDDSGAPGNGEDGSAGEEDAPKDRRSAPAGREEHESEEEAGHGH